MSSDVRRRVELIEELAPTVGRETAVRLVDEIPLVPSDVATRADLDALEQRIDDRMDDRMAALRGELAGAVGTLRADLERRIGDARAATSAELGAIRDDLRNQLRLMIFAILGTLFTLAGLTLATS
ncbi:MAG: hypothetical protein KY469_15330 [Actinobacteria bacterium]|nr:hypothetical protein [Actinomycetota bacterium]